MERRRSTYAPPFEQISGVSALLPREQFNQSRNRLILDYAVVGQEIQPGGVELDRSQIRAGRHS